MAAVTSPEADKQAKQTSTTVAGGVPAERFSVSSTQNVSRQPPQDGGLRLELWLQTLNTNMNEDLASFAVADTARPQFRSKIMTRRASLIYLGRDSEAFDALSTKSDVPEGGDSTGTPARDRAMDKSGPSLNSHTSAPDSPTFGIVGAAVQQGRLRRGSMCVQSEHSMLGTLQAGQQYMGLLGLDRLGRSSRMCSTSLDMDKAGQQAAPVRTSQRLRATILNDADFGDRSSAARRTKSTADIPNYSPPATIGSTRGGVRNSRLDSASSSPFKQPSCLKQTSTLPTPNRQGSSEIPRNSGQQARFASELTPFRTDFTRASAAENSRPSVAGFSRASLPVSTTIILGCESSSNSSISAPRDYPGGGPGSPLGDSRGPNAAGDAHCFADPQKQPQQQQQQQSPFSSPQETTTSLGTQQSADDNSLPYVQASTSWLKKLTAVFKSFFSKGAVSASTNSCDSLPHAPPCNAKQPTSSRQRWYQKTDVAAETDSSNMVQPFRQSGSGKA